MRVLELSDCEGAAAYCGKLLARVGAEVVKVERPQRDAPVEALDRFLNGGKRRVALDYRRVEDRERLDALAARCDALITDAPPSDVERFKLLALGGERRPAVRTSVTPFGLSGPYRDWRATAPTLLALGGYTFVMGDPGRAPLTMPGNYACYQAGTYAYVATVAAYLRALREPQRPPQAVEVSVLESLVSLHQHTTVQYTYLDSVRTRHGNRWGTIAPNTMLPSGEGWVGMSIVPAFWEPFALSLGRPDLIDDPRFATPAARVENEDALDAIIVECWAGRTAIEVMRDGQEHWRTPVGAALTFEQLLADPHLEARGFWQEVVDGGGRQLRYPRAPYRLPGVELPGERPAVLPGADTAALLDAPPGEEPPPRRAGADAASPRPLEGVRVLDLTRVWAGPLATRVLADLGADVIKIEAATGRGPATFQRPDGEVVERQYNRQGSFNKLNRNKRSVVLDLRSDEGKALFLRLVAVSDVVIENFSARAMTRLGLGYERLREANESVIYVAMPGFGATPGPYRDYVAFGPSVEPMTGLTAVMGYGPGEPRASAKALPDAMAGTTAAAAVVTALLERERSGRGVAVDMSQFETGVNFVGEFVLEQQLTGRAPAATGNAHPRFAPHGVYRCRGDDDWISITVRDDDEWASLCALAGCGWAEDARFTAAEARREHHAALDEAVEAWTAGRDKLALTADLQDAGVPAGAVLSAPELLADRHLGERGFFVELDQTDVGPKPYPGTPVLIGGRRGEGWVPAPALGQHNADVLGGLLGLDAAELAALAERGVIADRPPEQ